jgi:L-lactate dehydrogenase complex protein LldG
MLSPPFFGMEHYFYNPILSIRGTHSTQNLLPWQDPPDTEVNMEPTKNLIQSFTAAAEKVSAIVSEVSTMAQAFEYAVDLCERKEACRLLIAGCREPLSTPADKLCQHKKKKVIAAPVLMNDEAEQLATLCHTRGIGFIRNGLRDHLAGIDIGFTMADYGICETGTLVIDSSSEELRLATMVGEVHVAVLPKSRLRVRSLDLEAELKELMGIVPNYCAFITGASRTADIERVLALGVHGPLELHILLLEA